ncbi:MAG: RHS repeat domain-containing protein [Candidatus Dormiibacterota bacterium]
MKDRRQGTAPEHDDTHRENDQKTRAADSISDAKGDTTVFSASYSRNEDSLVTEDTSQPSADEYQYTGLNQVCYAAASNTAGCASAPSGSTAYSYDASGNLTDDNGTQQEFNAGDEFCWSVSGSSTNGCSSPPSGATDYSYGDDGDLTSITPPTGSATSLTYNAANELTSYQLGSGASTTYAYDGNGLRQSKTTGSSTTEFAWNASGSLPCCFKRPLGLTPPATCTARPACHWRRSCPVGLPTTTPRTISARPES